MKLNVRKFITLFLFLETCILLTGCSAAWLGAVSAMLPALETAVVACISFVAALEGKTVSADVAAKIKQIGSDIQAEIANVQQLIAQFQANADSGILAQINAVFSGITTNLGNILSAANVTDSSTIAKITSLVGLAIAAVQAITGLIPVATQKLKSASKSELAHYDKVAAVSVDNAHNGLKEAYKIVRDTPTENADVNAALATLPAQLP